EGRYRLVHKLGHGGHSTIWLARDLQNSRYVAVKVIIAFPVATQMNLICFAT
ncbi:hypothetical protein ASPTUDRAFT_123786, partial [Aspergillus tubingensis CBS 134.48]